MSVRGCSAHPLVIKDSYWSASVACRRFVATIQGSCALDCVSAVGLQTVLWPGLVSKQASYLMAILTFG